MTSRKPFQPRSVAAAPFAIALLLAAFQGCRLVPYEVELKSITVSPPSSRIAATTTQQFTATGRYSDDEEKDLTADAVWTSSDPSVATVSSGGLATPLASGTTTITASTQGRSGSTTLTVTNALLQSIEVTPANPSIANGTRQPFTATGRFDDGSAQDLTAAVTWTSSDPSVSIGNVSGSQGLAASTALGAATSVITATLGPISGTTVLTVKAVTLASVSASPASATIQVGQAQQFEATGSFSDGSSQTMTREVTWSSSATSVATIAPTGRATGVFAGTTTIAATSSALLGSVAGTAQLTVQTAGPGY